MRAHSILVSMKNMWNYKGQQKWSHNEDRALCNYSRYEMGKQDLEEGYNVQHMVRRNLLRM